MKKQLVRVQIPEYLSLYDMVDGQTPQDIITRMNQLLIKHAAFEKLTFDANYSYDGDLPEITLYGERPENKEERRERLDFNRKVKAFAAQKKNKQITIINPNDCSIHLQG